MNKIILVIAMLSISSCVAPYSTYDYAEPTPYQYYPAYYQPTKVVIIKNKPHHKHKRHIKVRINKHRKRK